MIVLAADVGNSQTMMGLYRADRLLNEWRMATNARLSAGRLWGNVSLFCAETNVEPSRIEAFAVACVVPQAMRAFRSMSRIHLRNAAIVVVSTAVDVGLRIHYDEPRALGADRICSAVAAFAKYGGPVIVIDFGTATTYDAISKTGEFLGGAIAPGIGTTISALSERTAKLPTIVPTAPKNVVGTNTRDCITSGVVFGAIDALDGMVRRLKRVVGRRAKVIATGGFAPFIASHSSAINDVDPYLVLDGARRIATRELKKKTG